MGETKNMTEKEWLIARDHGIDGSVKWAIGGSDVATVFGLNPWRTILDLYDQKKGIEHVIPRKMNQAALDAGHRYEDMIAQEFHMIMNTMMKKHCTVINDTNMYRHGEFVKDKFGDLIMDEDGNPVLKYPFALANLDRMIEIEGKKGILEIKTTSGLNYSKVEDWKNGIVPINYELQCRYYMAIMDLPFTYICCKWGYKIDEVQKTIFGFLGSDIVAIRINRDLDIEQIIMDNVQAFVNCLDSDTLPDINDEDSEKILIYYGNLYGEGNESISPIELPLSCQADVISFLETEKKIKDLKNQIKALEQLKTKPMANLAPYFKEAANAIVEMEDDNIAYLKFKTNHIDKFDEDKLKTEHPEIWTEISKLDTTTFKEKHSELVDKYLLPAEPNPKRSMKISVKKKKVKKI